MTAAVTTKQKPFSMRTIDELRLNVKGNPQSYFVANYQRGCRWSTTKVTQLLGGISDSTNLVCLPT